MISHTKSIDTVIDTPKEQYYIKYNYEWVAVFRKNKLSHPSETAIILKQLFYMNEEEFGCKDKDGNRWIYQTYAEWGKQSGGLNRHQIAVIGNQLERLGIVNKAKFAALRHDFVNQAPQKFNYCNQTTWWCLNEKRLYEYLGLKYGTKPNVNIDDTPTETTDTIECELDEHSSIYNTSSIFQQPEAKEKEIAIDDFWNEPEAANEEDSIPIPPPPKKRIKQSQANNKLLVEPEVSQQSSEEPNKETLDVKPWETAPGRYHALFVKWWAETHFKPQGGHWESGANIYAMSYIKNHPDEVEQILYPRFLGWMKQLRDNCNQTQVNDIKTLLPSWFAEDPEATEENTRQIINDFQVLIDRGAELALPNNHAPGSKQSIPLSQSMNSKAIQPMQDLKTPQLEASKKNNPITKKQLDLINEYWDGYQKEHPKSQRMIRNFLSRYKEFVELTDKGVDYKF
ncbi:MAG: hypothetical protein WBA41_17290 [Rivularia sp. (in: cyanobacteria)]